MRQQARPQRLSDAVFCHAGQNAVVKDLQIALTGGTQLAGRGWKLETVGYATSTTGGGCDKVRDPDPSKVEHARHIHHLQLTLERSTCS